MSRDTSTAHEKALLTQALKDGTQLAIKYMYTSGTVENAKLSAYIGSTGWLRMEKGKFYICTSITSYVREVYANGYSPPPLNFVWWLDESRSTP